MTKGREIIIFVKSQLPFDVHRQYLDVSLIDLQARISREFEGFALEFFTALLMSRKPSSIIIDFYLLKAISTSFSYI